MPPKHAALAAMVAVIWGVNFVVIDAGLKGVPPLLFLALRFSIVSLAVLFVRRPPVPFRQVALVGLFMSIGQFGCLYTALHLDMPPGLASLVLQAQVLVTVLVAALVLAERPSPRQLMGIVVGAVGLLVVALGRSGHTPAIALALTLAGATSWAIGNVVSRQVAAPSGFALTVWSATVVPLPLLGLSLLLDGPATVGHALAGFTLKAALSTLYTACLASLVGYGTWNTLLSKHTAAAVVPFALLVPPVGILAAWLVQGETPNAAELAGGAVLLAGVAITVLRRRTTRPIGARRTGGLLA